MLRKQHPAIPRLIKPKEIKGQDLNHITHYHQASDYGNWPSSNKQKWNMLEDGRIGILDKPKYADRIEKAAKDG